MSTIIGVIGTSEASTEEYQTAEEVGREIARRKGILVCGGLGGVMEASCRGAKSEGGLTIGIIPGSSKKEANPYVDIPIVTGISEARKIIVVRSSNAIISVGLRLIIPGHKISGLIWPVQGKITSQFGRRGWMGFHSGIDIAAPKGTPVRAVADGLVIVSAHSLDGYSGYGKVIIIEHGDGIKTLYAHNKNNLVEIGECIREGEIIAEVGSSGNASGSHLHFEIRKDRKPVNPLKYLP